MRMVKVDTRILFLLLSVALLVTLFQNCSGGTHVGDAILDTPDPDPIEKFEFKIGAYDPMPLANFGTISELKICTSYIKLKYTELYEPVDPPADWNSDELIYEWKPGIFVDTSYDEIWVEIWKGLDFKPDGISLGEFDIPTGAYSHFWLEASTQMNNFNVAPGDCIDPENETIRMTLGASRTSFTSDNTLYITFDGAFEVRSSPEVEFDIQGFIDLLVQQETADDFKKNIGGNLNF